ncbi:AAA family ATPase [Legionella longbeachae]|nr:AAA family ATPase [Legionella longbeachae]
MYLVIFNLYNYKFQGWDMANIVNLNINNFRGINNFDINFPLNSDFVCFIGRGDSCKTSILDAISLVLSPKWSISFQDSDFFNCNIESPIEISVSLVNFPEKLISESKYGLYVRAYDPIKMKILDDFVGEEQEFLPALTIRLVVDSQLLPKWTVSNAKHHEDKIISNTDRESLSCFMISDFIDRHFTWSKGNPLFTLSSLIKDLDENDKNIIIDALREAKKQIDTSNFNELNEITELIKSQASLFGLDIKNIHSTIDFRELAIKDDRISLHDDLIPFRLKGKGSRRLASFAIQSILVKRGGILLVDELEQGLEPDRIKQLVRTLRDIHEGQIFITTHSREVIVELESNNLIYVQKDSENHISHKIFNHDKKQLQAIVRACPEAFFANKIVICEGATEIGICRALDKYRMKLLGKNSFSLLNCAYIDGGGSNLAERAKQIKDVGLDVAILCDSDRDLTPSKPDLLANDIKIFDCEIDYCIEKQAFMDLPWIAIQRLIDYVCKSHKNGDFTLLEKTIKSKYPNGFLPHDWQEIDNKIVRETLISASIISGKEWFKRIDHGEALGDVIFEYIDDIKNKKIGSMLLGLSDWVDN